MANTVIVNAAYTQPLLSEITNITSAQIKALHASPVTVVPAVSGYAIIPVIATIDYTFGSVAYTSSGSAVMNFSYPSGAACSLTGTASNFITQSGITSSVSVSTPDNTFFLTQSTLKGTALQVSKTAAGEFATGDGTLQVQVIYYLAPMA